MSAITNRFRKNPKNPMKKSTTAVATYAHGGIRSPGGHWSGPGTIVVVVPVATMMTGMRNPPTLWPLTLLGEVADVAAELVPVGLLPVGLAVVTAVATPRLANITPTGWSGGQGGGAFSAGCFHWPSASGGGLFFDYVAP